MREQALAIAKSLLDILDIETIAIAKSLLDILDIETISQKTGLSIAEIENLT